ncbi:ArgE/DapE family deacylase [Microbacterium awajiense]|uniref:ArgE/DapE family deacylase n=1 Tax=Microbacterium awajiense TaxID=415214 RepID=A0ABP7AVA8_9MICO
MQPDDVVDLTAALIGIDSVSPSLVPGAAGERRIADYVASWLENAGFRVRLVPAVADPRRISVVAVRAGTVVGRTVVLNGHLDTVGVEEMVHPFAARLDGDRLTGRGSSDMKGGLAGLLVAAKQLARQDAPGTIIVAFVADEEDGSVGAETVIDVVRSMGIVPDVCLIAEPTGLDLAIAHRGYAVFDVDLRGRAAHSSQPESSVDALRALGDLLGEIARFDHGLTLTPAHPLLGHGSLRATTARSGTATFTIAANAHVAVERRTLPGESPQRALGEVQGLVDSVVARTPGLRADVRRVLDRDAWQAGTAGDAAALSQLLATSLASAGVQPGRFGAPYWMESALWEAAGIPTVVCGPAGGGLHAVDEWVDVGQLRAFPVAVADAVGRFLGQRA